jgi:hypothetical protein
MTSGNGLSGLGLFGGAGGAMETESAPKAEKIGDDLEEWLDALDKRFEVM